MIDGESNTFCDGCGEHLDGPFYDMIIALSSEISKGQYFYWQCPVCGFKNKEDLSEVHS